MSEIQFTDQVAAIIRERDSLRVENKALRDSVQKVTQQYDDLAEDHGQIVSNYERRLHDAYTARDKAERAVSEVNVILRGCAEHVMQGLRAIKGNQIAEQHKAEPPPLNTTAAPLHAPGNHPRLVEAIDRANVSVRS